MSRSTVLAGAGIAFLGGLVGAVNLLLYCSLNESSEPAHKYLCAANPGIPTLLVVGGPLVVSIAARRGAQSRWIFHATWAAWAALGLGAAVLARALD